ncbi:uncharacterized protein V6R79_004975 [Siganus canaliculatus]
MKRTFECNESMIITIPIGTLKNPRHGQLMPEKFQCVYRDCYKVFVVNGKPKPLGAAQAITGVFILTLGLIFTNAPTITRAYTLPSVLFVVSGMLSYAAGLSPNIHVAKLSFSLNIISFLWSAAAVCICGIYAFRSENELQNAIGGMIMTLLIVEKLTSLFLIYWLSKAVCRHDFNTLPIILLKQED